jgi:hypothetical protein
MLPRKLLVCFLFLVVLVSAEAPLALEIGAILQVRNLNSAETMYSSQFGRYATKLEELGPPAKGAKPSEAAADLIPADLANGVRNGYRFTLAGTSGGYTIHADPLKYPDTGRRSFFSDESLAIRQNRGDAPATAASPELQ